MYYIIHARRPTDRRPEADARGRTPGRSSNACAQGTREARGYRFIRGATQVRGRVGLVTPRVGATRTASHERRSRNLRSGLRRVWTQAQAPQTASTVTRSIPRVPPFFVTYERGDAGPASLRGDRNLLLLGSVITPDNPWQSVTYVPGLFRYRCRRLHNSTCSTFFWGAFTPTVPGHSCPKHDAQPIQLDADETAYFVEVKDHRTVDTF